MNGMFGQMPYGVGMQYSMPPVSPLGALMGAPYGYGQGAVGLLNQFLMKQFDDRMRENEDPMLNWILNERAAVSRPQTLMDMLGVTPFM